MKIERKMMLVTQISTQEEFDEMKEIMEIFVVKRRVSEIVFQD